MRMSSNFNFYGLEFDRNNKEEFKKFIEIERLVLYYKVDEFKSVWQEIFEILVEKVRDKQKINWFGVEFERINKV